jgi:SAM-dependent methyltransferase
MSNWFEDENFWQTTFPMMFSREQFERARNVIDPLLELAGYHDGPILDLACGPGRYSVPLAQRGIAVTGVDRTKFLLGKAREYAEREGVEVELVEQDMRDFVRENAFALAINMFTSFGYFDTREEDLQVARNMYRSLQRGGACVIDVAGKEMLSRIWQPTGSERFDDGSLLVNRREVRDDYSRVHNEWILIREATSEVISFSFEHFIYSAYELKSLLLEAGFDHAEAYGTLDGKPYDQAATRLVVVGRKEG